MIEDILLVLYLSIFFIGLFFPIIFAFYRKLNNKVLFLSSVYGINLIVWLLLTGAAAPIYAVMIYIFPTLYEIELTSNILWLIAIFEFSESWWSLFSVITLFLFPSIINRRYNFAF